MIDSYCKFKVTNTKLKRGKKSIHLMALTRRKKLITIAIIAVQKMFKVEHKYMNVLS